MAKHVFGSHADVVHAFANSGSEAGSYGRSGNIFFENGTLFSYGRHYVIAKYAETNAGETVILFSDRRYSNSTSKHQSIAASALRHWPIIRVPDAGSSPNSNFAIWHGDALALNRKLERARKPELYLLQLAAIETKAAAYAAAFGLTIRPELAFQLSTSDADRVRLANEIREQREREKAANVVRLERELAKWRNGEASRLYNSPIDYLRVDRVADRIETSQGVRIGLRAGRRLYDALRIARGSNPQSERYYDAIQFLKDHTRRLTGFNFRGLTANTLRIGCHNIPLSEVDRIADQLGWNAGRIGPVESALVMPTVGP
jgi:hypothetical protein